MTSIRARLLLYLIAPLIVLASLVAWETFYSSRNTSNELSDKTLLAVMLALSENILATQGEDLAEKTLEAITSNLGDQFFYHLAGPDNAFVTGYSGAPPLREGTTLTGGVPVFYDGMYQDVPVRVVAVRLLISGREINGWATLTTWQRVTQRNALTFALFGRSLTRFILLISAAGLIAWFAVAYGLRPLVSLQEAIAKRAPNELTPIRRALPAELNGIVTAMNELLARVARSKVNRERFIGDAAHQLRNPIAALKTQTQTTLGSDDETSLRAGLERILETTSETERLVELMLTSSVANSLSMDTIETVNLVPLVEEVARVHAPAALAKSQDYALDLPSDRAIVRGNGALLREAVSNLIDNAIRHCSQGTEINIGLVHAPGGKQVRIVVSDTDRTLTAQDLNQLSQPFSTGRARSSGSGLGLSIAKDVAKAHGGNLTVTPHSGTDGKTFTIILPLAVDHEVNQADAAAA